MTQNRRERGAVGKEAEGKEAEKGGQSYRLFIYRLFRRFRYLPRSYPMSGCPVHMPERSRS